MPHDDLLYLFVRFGLAALLGFLIGLERELRDEKSVTLGIRDFVMFSLLGAVSSFAALQYDNPWLIVAALFGTLALILSSYWADRDHGAGITTELAALGMFFVGAIIMRGQTSLGVALAILTLGVLFPKRAIQRFRSQVQIHEMRAVLLFLIITFIVLPILPRQSLDVYLTLPVGQVSALFGADQSLEIQLAPDVQVEQGGSLLLLDSKWRLLGKAQVTSIEQDQVRARYEGEDYTALRPGAQVRSPFGVDAINVMLSALHPYKIWLIVVLVSFISFVGYVLIKLLGSGAGIGLTGLVGGLVSSTVTTLSFAKRSRETPAANPLFAMAVILAGSIMFPRLLLEMAVVNQQLMKNVAVPMAVMGLTGAILAGVSYWRAGREKDRGEAPTVHFDNPFSLRAAIAFALVFGTILMATRLASTYLGSGWLPAVAVVSGLTDADAIAFSLSDLQRAGLISLDWASFNLVLGALSNTFMKLFLVFSLGDRGLFKRLAVSFSIIGAVGFVTMLLYYDL